MLLFTSCFQRGGIRKRSRRRNRQARRRRWVRRVAGGVEWVGEKLGGQEEEEGSKRRKRTHVRGGAVEGEWEEGGKTTLAQYELIMQQFKVNGS